MKDRKIGMLGAGNMAGAMIRGLLASKSLLPEQIRGSDVRVEHLAELERTYGINSHTDNPDLLSCYNLVLRLVKPKVIGLVLVQLDVEIPLDSIDVPVDH